MGEFPAPVNPVPVQPAFSLPPETVTKILGAAVVAYEEFCADNIRRAAEDAHLPKDKAERLAEKGKMPVGEELMGEIMQGALSEFGMNPQALSPTCCLVAIVGTHYFGTRKIIGELRDLAKPEKKPDAV